MTTFCGLDYYASDELYQDWLEYEYEYDDEPRTAEDDWLYEQSKIELDRETALNSPW